MSKRTDKDLRLLNFTKVPTLEEVKARYHELSLIYHPDHGGDPVTFNEICKAYKRLKGWMTKPVRCLTCKGGGYTRRSSGLYAVKERCADCNGKGKAQRCQ